MTYIPERNSLLLLHGSLNDFWSIRATTFDFSKNIRDPANWIASLKKNFYIGQEGVHVCDPSLLELPSSKSSKILFHYSYDQRYLYQEYADVSIVELFDKINHLTSLQNFLRFLKQRQRYIGKLLWHSLSGIHNLKRAFIFNNFFKYFMFSAKPLLGNNY